MKYLPFEDLTYKTHLSAEEVLTRLEENIEPPKTFRLGVMFGSSDHKPYEGRIEGNSFRITRIIGYRNSFLPRIAGQLEHGFSGTKIHVKMNLHPLVIAFVIIWCGGLGAGLFAFLPSAFEEGRADWAALIPLGMIVFVYVMVTGAFKYESLKTRKYLTQLFDAEIERG